MISMPEINQLLKENFQQQLSTIKDLPEDLAKGYKVWVQSLVKAAGQKMQQDISESGGHATQEQDNMPPQ